MKFNKLAALGLAGVLAIGSAIPFFAENSTEALTESVEVESETETALEKAEYTIFNTTGETVTELYLTEHVRPTEEAATESTDEDAVEVETEEATEAEEVEAENLVGEEGLAAGESIVLTQEATAEAAALKEYTLTFVTESGYVGEFTTLHFEVAPICLLAEDAVSGATQIAFGAPVVEDTTEGMTE